MRSRYFSLILVASLLIGPTACSSPGENNPSTSVSSPNVDERTSANPLLLIAVLVALIVVFGSAALLLYLEWTSHYDNHSQISESQKSSTLPGNVTSQNPRPSPGYDNQEPAQPTNQSQTAHSKHKVGRQQSQSKQNTKKLQQEIEKLQQKIEKLQKEATNSKQERELLNERLTTLEQSRTHPQSQQRKRNDLESDYIPYYYEGKYTQLENTNVMYNTVFAQEEMKTPYDKIQKFVDAFNNHDQDFFLQHELYYFGLGRATIAGKPDQGGRRTIEFIDNGNSRDAVCIAVTINSENYLFPNLLGGYYQSPDYWLSDNTDIFDYRGSGGTIQVSQPGKVQYNQQRGTWALVTPVILT